MADYSLDHAHKSARSASGGLRYSGWALTAVAVVMLAVLAWVWTQQQTTDSLLPQTAGPPAAAALSPAPVVASPAPPAASRVTPPPSAAVAAAGDTRAARP